MGSTQSTWGASIRTIITQPSSLGYVITQYLHKPTLQSTTGSITLQLPTMLFATIITPALLFAGSSLAQMSMPGMSTSMDTAMSMPGMSMSSTSMDPAMSMPNAMSSGMTMTTTASSAKSSLMASATSTSSSSSATVSTNAAPGSTGPSEAMIAAIGLVTWVALGVSNVF